MPWWLSLKHRGQTSAVVFLYASAQTPFDFVQSARGSRATCIRPTDYCTLSCCPLRQRGLPGEDEENERANETCWTGEKEDSRAGATWYNDAVIHTHLSSPVPQIRADRRETNQRRAHASVSVTIECCHWCIQLLCFPPHSTPLLLSLVHTQPPLRTLVWTSTEG